MKIPFRKIGDTPQDFETEKTGVTFRGSLRAYERNLILLNGHISGTIEVPCDLCAENFDTILDEELTILLSDGIFHGNDDQYDVVELIDGIVDTDTILESELELERSGYHSCASCQDKTL